jgi:hypothetical protein
MVVGFSGPLAGAYKIIESIRRNFTHYSKPPVAINLLQDVERWIRHEYKTIPAIEREKLSFVVSAVEPKREKRSKWYGQNGKEKPKPNWFPYIPELSSFTLIPSSKNPDRLMKQERDMCKIIGVAEDTRIAIENRVMEMFGFSFKQPNLQAIAIVNQLMYDLMEKGLLSVGGLFQCAILGVNGIEWLTYSLPSEYGSVSLEIRNGQYIQRDNITEREVPLLTISDWWKEWQKKGELGKTGTFEDPAFREVVNKRKNDDE